jgi:hypothetical protein
LNELKGTEARRDRAVGLWRLSGSPDEIVCFGAGDIFRIQDRSCAIASNPAPSFDIAGSQLKRTREK